MTKSGIFGNQTTWLGFVSLEVKNDFTLSNKLSQTGIVIDVLEAENRSGILSLQIVTPLIPT